MSERIKALPFVAYELFTKNYCLETFRTSVPCFVAQGFDQECDE